MPDPSPPHNLVVHGAFDYAELASLDLQPDEMLDFSVNSNPYGPSPLVSQALARMPLERYPDRDCQRLRTAILTYELPAFSFTSAHLICGNGASELIWLLARAFLQPGARTAIIGPTFGEYAAASQASGATVFEYRTPLTTPVVDVDALLSWLGLHKPRLVWLCNPNNPTGTLLSLASVRRIAEMCRDLGAFLIVDESYHRFVWPAEPFSAAELLSQSSYAHVLVLRSLTKDFALAALRLGYLIADPAQISRVAAHMPSWNVSGLAQEGGCVALADRDHLTRTFAKLEIEREHFFAAIHEQGIALLPSRTHFCLVRVGDARRVRGQLLRRKLLVRDCTSFGLPEYIRVATRQAHDWKALLIVLEEVLAL